MVTTLLRLAGVAKERAGGFAVAAPDIVLAPGEAVALTGASGSGKSTLLLLMAGALPPDAGRILLHPPGAPEADIAALWRAGARAGLAALRARHVGVVPQTGGLIPFLDVAGNILLPQRLAARQDVAHARRLAEELGLDALWHRDVAALSVGERQRVAIARALAHRPALVLADEPTASVHPALADTILALLLRECRAVGAALVVATHDAPRALALGLGHIACTLTPDAAQSSFARAEALA